MSGRVRFTTVLPLLLALATLSIAGCNKVGVVRLSSVSRRAPKPATCHLDVYTSKQAVKRRFVEVCLIDSRTGTTAFHDKSAASAIENARPAACRCGADALLIARTDTEGVSLAGWGQGKAIIKAIAYVR